MDFKHLMNASKHLSLTNPHHRNGSHETYYYNLQLAINALKFYLACFQSRRESKCRPLVVCHLVSDHLRSTLSTFLEWDTFAGLDLYYIRRMVRVPPPPPNKIYHQSVLVRTLLHQLSEVLDNVADFIIIIFLVQSIICIQ